MVGQRSEVTVAGTSSCDANACAELTVCGNPECSEAITIATRTDLNAYVIQAVGDQKPIMFYSRNVVFHVWC